MAYTKKQLESLVNRRHPQYQEMKEHWDFLGQTYDGGRKWFTEKNLFKYFKEGSEEYTARLNRGYRFNHSKQIVSLVSKYLFKQEIKRNKEDAPDFLRRFWNKTTKNGRSIDDFMVSVDTKTSTFGKCWIVVDSNATGEKKSVAKSKQMQERAFAYIVQPQNALDMSFDDYGELIWFLSYEPFRDDADPIESEGDDINAYRLWTRDDWILIAEDASGSPVVIDQGANPLGEVPVVSVDVFKDDDDLYTTPALLNDIAYLDRAVANYLSNLDAIIQDQTFSQLAIPAQGLTDDDEGKQRRQMIEFGTKRVFVWDAERTNAQPFYLSPDASQAKLIGDVVHSIIAEIYHCVGLSGERTKEDNAMGIDNSSGVAKAFDFERINNILVSKGKELERAENRIARLVSLWNNAQVDEESLEDERLVDYPESYDARGFAEELSIAKALSEIQAPKQIRRMQMKETARQLFPTMSKKDKSLIDSEIENWPSDESLVNKSSVDTDLGDKRAGQGSVQSQTNSEEKEELNA